MCLLNWSKAFCRCHQHWGKENHHKLKNWWQSPAISWSRIFITVKYHQGTFPNFSTVRLINPSKSKIRKISKSILDKINNALVEKTKVNQWKNSANTIKWFKNIPNKKASSFVNFDVEHFYPPTSEKLLADTISYAKSLINVTEGEYSIIMHSRKMRLFKTLNRRWKKTVTRTLMFPWDVLMEHRFVSL